MHTYHAHILCPLPAQCYNKIDQISLEEVDRLAREPHSVVISCEMHLNLDYLLVKIWDYLSLLRVYTKRRGGISLCLSVCVCVCVSILDSLCECVYPCVHLYAYYTVVSWASTHSWVTAHIPRFKGLCSSFYTNVWKLHISRVSAHTGQNCKLCLSAHGCLPGTLQYLHI